MMTSQNSPQYDAFSVQSFFELFERLSRAPDVDGLRQLYAPTLLVAGLAGSRVVPIEGMLAAMPQRRQLLESMGCGPGRLISLEETTLNPRYSLVRTEWRWTVRSADSAGAATDVTVASTFVLEHTADGMRIITYMPHGDVMEELRMLRKSS